VNDKLKYVVRGSIIRPVDKKYHTKDIPVDHYRVEVDRALLSYKNFYPPNQPDKADSELKVSELKGWLLIWPKTLIRTNTTSGSTASKRKQVAPQQPALEVSAPPKHPTPEVSAPVQ
jgi:hypothetical protein